MPASQAGRRRFDSGRPLHRRPGGAGPLQPRVRVAAAFVPAFTQSLVLAIRGIRCRWTHWGSSLDLRRPDSMLDVTSETECGEAVEPRHGDDADDPDRGGARVLNQ